MKIFPTFTNPMRKITKKILPSWRCREPVAGPKSDMANEVWNSLEISILAILYPSWTIFISVSYQFHMSFIWVSYPISMQRSPPSIHISVTAHGDYRQGPPPSPPEPWNLWPQKELILSMFLGPKARQFTGLVQWKNPWKIYRKRQDSWVYMGLLGLPHFEISTFHFNRVPDLHNTPWWPSFQVMFHQSK